MAKEGDRKFHRPEPRKGASEWHPEVLVVIFVRNPYGKQQTPQSETPVVSSSEPEKSDTRPSTDVGLTEYQKKILDSAKKKPSLRRSPPPTNYKPRQEAKGGFISGGGPASR
jgi:hypothetical protein